MDHLPVMIEWVREERRRACTELVNLKARTPVKAIKQFERGAEPIDLTEDAIAIMQRHVTDLDDVIARFEEQLRG